MGETMTAATRPGCGTIRRMGNGAVARAHAIGDGAMAVLAATGAKGLTHRAVDDPRRSASAEHRGRASARGVRLPQHRYTRDRAGVLSGRPRARSPAAP